MMEVIAAFTAGILLGLILVLSFVMYLGTRSLTKKRAEFKTKLEGLESIEAKMKRVREIAEEMLDLYRMTDHPQKNSLDGKYKNGIIGQIKILEDEKNDLLRSIISDGHDPELSTIDGSGVVTRMKLSQYMVDAGISMSPKEKPDAPKVEQVGKFTVIRGGKDPKDSSH
jgi:hypothetical protein